MTRTSSDIETLATEIVDACVMVHRHLGPGLLESAYTNCLAYELRSRDLDVRLEVPLGLQYGDFLIQAAYRLDMLVADRIIIENKSVDSLHPIHQAQLLTYLRLSGLHLGFLINWNVPVIKAGIKRMVHHL